MAGVDQERTVLTVNTHRLPDRGAPAVQVRDSGQYRTIH